jgi:predicted DNA-binding transcriptional regulator AlpA
MTNSASKSEHPAGKYRPETYPEASLPPLCRLKDLLRVVTIKRSTVWRWVQQGRFPKPIKHHGLTAWRRSDILAWLVTDGGEP